MKAMTNLPTFFSWNPLPDSTRNTIICTHTNPQDAGKLQQLVQWLTCVMCWMASETSHTWLASIIWHQIRIDLHIRGSNYTHAQTHARRLSHIHTSTTTCTHTHTHIHTHTHSITHQHTHTHTHTHTPTHIHTHQHTHTHTHTHTNTHIHTQCKMCTCACAYLCTWLCMNEGECMHMKKKKRNKNLAKTSHHYHHQTHQWSIISDNFSNLSTPSPIICHILPNFDLESSKAFIQSYLASLKRKRTTEKAHHKSNCTGNPIFTHSIHITCIV